MGLAANKFDLFETQEIDENDGKQYAKKIGAIFSCTSAKESIGIEYLFKEIGEKILNENKDKMFENNLPKNLINFENNNGKAKCCK